jgi:[ribosomal protein S5]-alanine N-acetyltransferase
MIEPLPPTPTLETKRLILRPIGLADAPAVQRLFPHWEIVRYLQAGVSWPFPTDGAETHLRKELAAVARGEKNVWAIGLKARPDDLIGSINLRAAPPGEDNRGFWLGLAWHRQGLMTEAAQAVTTYAFEILGWSSLTASNAESNLASRRIKEAQGAVLVGRTTGRWVSGEGPKEIWRIERGRSSG